MDMHTRASTVGPVAWAALGLAVFIVVLWVAMLTWGIFYSPF